MKPRLSSKARLALLVGIAGVVGLVAVMLRAADSGDSRAQPAVMEQPAAAVPVAARTSTRSSFAKSPARAEQPDLEARRLHPVDLDVLREKIPDNYYWRFGEPTLDAEALKIRGEEQRRWDELRGKVVSNTASEEEIDRYYDYRQRLSKDYIQFSELLLEHYRAEISESEVGLHEMSIKMHTGRLDEIPRQREEAKTRKLAQDKRREEWKRGR
jgi:hypothetical protein